jgi:hypothetical protein
MFDYLNSTLKRATSSLADSIRRSLYLVRAPEQPARPAILEESRKEAGLFWGSGSSHTVHFEAEQHVPRPPFRLKRARREVVEEEEERDSLPLDFLSMK